MTQAAELNNTEGLDFTKSRAAKKQHDKIVAWTNQQFQMIRNGRVTTERQWYLNLAFYFGRQYVQVLKPQGSTVNSTTRLWTPPAPYYRKRLVINRIRKTIRDELARLTSNKPNIAVVPSSADDRDLYAAQAGEQIWEWLYDDKKVKSILRRSLWWMLVCGNGFLKVWWDPVKDDVCFASETPFHVFCPDLREEELESQPFLIHAQVKSEDWIRMNFKDGKALDGTNLAVGDARAQDILEQSYLNMTGTPALQKQNNTIIYEVWVKPGSVPLLPEGAQFTMVGNKIVQGQQGWPYSHGLYPFIKFDHILSGKFYTTSSIDDLIPLQKEYNRTRSQIVEAKDRTAKPQLTYQRGAIDPSKITTEPGLAIPVTPGFDSPKPLPLSPLPSYVLEELDRTIVDWNDISGAHEVSRGQTPPGVTAATAISYLQERDEASMSPTFDSLEEGLGKAAHETLTLIKDYWSVPRIISITGTDGSFDAMTFVGSDLGNNLNVKIESGSSLPVSKAAKQAFILDLMKMGFIDPQKGLEVMDMGGINKIYEQIQVDQKQAQRENLRMSKVDPNMLMEYDQQNQMLLAQNPNHFGTISQTDPTTGQPIQAPNTPPLIVPVNTWDNHKLHIMYHNNFRKSQTFESLPPEIKQIFEEHVQQHIQAMGIEQITQNPSMVAGIPPGIQATLGQSQTGQPPQQAQNQNQNPGPSPMPDLNSGGLTNG